MASVEFKNVGKKYTGNVEVVKGFNLKIEEGEFVVFLGPSGCGKSTILRMLAGLEDISSGEVMIGDVVVNKIEPKYRNIAMVFQSYALYPHMTVYDNIAFSLKLAGTKKEEIKKIVRPIADMLQLTPVLDRKPGALSGGQRQRVAMGRAMVRTPEVFLFDEPLSNLDAKLRNAMRTEIKSLQDKLKKTTVYVTHDQVEAMTLADRIVVLKDGFIEQVGTPEEIYHSPANIFVAGFIGSPTMNFVDVTLTKKDKWTISISDKELSLPFDFNVKHDEKQVVAGIRPSDIYLSNEGLDNVVRLDAEIISCELLGSMYEIELLIGGGKLTAEVSVKDEVVESGDISVYVDISNIHIFEKESGKSIKSS